MSNRIVDTTWDDLLSAGIVGIIVWLFWKAIIVALFIGILLLSKVSLPSTEAVFKGIGALIATGYLVYIFYLIDKQDKKRLKHHGKTWLWIGISVLVMWIINQIPSPIIGILIGCGYLAYMFYLIIKWDKKQLKKNGKVWLWIIISIFAIWAISKATYLILALN